MNKYQIIDKRLLSGNSILCFDKSNKEWFWIDINISDMLPDDVRFFHTKTQLIQSGFEEVFTNKNCEVLEVGE
ncbi:Uncharacterised protein [Streptococcus pseudoporcinus]|uniref:Uncharacterized protein n=1 Tax=Streptococcus pseudoporcinus TaxID=361101 RepID=A0A4U9Y0Z5_9STRE|nr:hypothetical protein [Streptococcus pseudoporcinus]QBX18702.1 hypothetical protein Javan443_0028 [Streptococcus phage Javan443]QBX18779.1 hypothetical protein Javan445_0039 [Streptococcus phage Javan445]VTS19674.1 Uncharacterised protein [Streptococcus pseudoporcinus]VUC69711.1 Uncharacterised protein [Streptococcus pseudoporcinus]VUD00001.1 Uncharacterised protein [Streptococcus pseudoporcinus]